MGRVAVIHARIGALSGLCAGLLLAGCATQPVTDLTDNADVKTLSADQRRLWDAAGRLDESIAKRRLVYRDAELNRYVQSVLDGLYPEFAGTLRVQLFDSPHLNAFCLPNGHIYFNTGLLARLDNEAQLATVLAHEAAHFIQQHSLQQRQQADGVVLFGTGVELLTGIPLSGSLLAASVLSGYSQAHENEADEQGFARLVQSGYDAREAPKTFRKLLDEVTALDIDEPFMFSSHPKLKDRIGNFERLVAETGVSGGTRHGERFRQLTGTLREQTLVRYLDMNNHKVLLLILNNDTLRARYTRYPDYYRGEAYLLRNDDGDAARAQTAFEASIAADPGYSAAYRALGLLLMKQGERAAARDRLDAYLAMQPDARDRAYIESYLKQLRD